MDLWVNCAQLGWVLCQGSSCGCDQMVDGTLLGLLTEIKCRWWMELEYSRGFPHSHVWQLILVVSWGCWPEHLHMAS